jgi:uncharacterized SAM-binding protein YcdF (DUF218 family)
MVLGLGALFALTWRYWATLPAAALVRDDAPFGAVDAIIPLMGDRTGQRADRVFDLWRAGVAPRIVIVPEEPQPFGYLGLERTGDESHALLLETKGVPAEAIARVPKCIATSTRDEALCIRAWVETTAPSVRRVVIVTSWYHSRRAAWLFERALTPIGVEVAVAAAASPQSRPEGWWTEEASFLAVYTEYLKWCYWLVRVAMDD